MKDTYDIIYVWLGYMECSSFCKVLFVILTNYREVSDVALHFIFNNYLKRFLLFRKNAEKGGYAIGAFNVYNMEGVEAVISAAEAANSPAILQVDSSHNNYNNISSTLNFICTAKFR